MVGKADAGDARRFVPEAMRGAGTGTLIAQRSSGTAIGPESGPFHHGPQPCWKRWFVSQFSTSDVTPACLGLRHEADVRTLLTNPSGRSGNSSVTRLIFGSFL